MKPRSIKGRASGVLKRSLFLLVPLLLCNCGSSKFGKSHITRVAPIQRVATLETTTLSEPVSSPEYETIRTLRGKASWYSVKTNRGTATASGERLSDSAMTAAHKTLPMGTRVRVTNLRNGSDLVLRINDRGPYIRGRIIDVTIGAARKLDMVNAGVVPAKVEVLKSTTNLKAKAKAKAKGQGQG